MKELVMGSVGCKNVVARTFWFGLVYHGTGGRPVSSQQDRQVQPGLLEGRCAYAEPSQVDLASLGLLLCTGPHCHAIAVPHGPGDLAEQTANAQSRTCNGYIPLCALEVKGWLSLSVLALGKGQCCQEDFIVQGRKVYFMYNASDLGRSLRGRAAVPPAPFLGGGGDENPQKALLLKLELLKFTAASVRFASGLVVVVVPAYLQSASESVCFLWVKNSTGNKLQNHLRLVTRGIVKPDATVALPAVIWLDLFKKSGATTQGQCNKRVITQPQTNNPAELICSEFLDGPQLAGVHHPGLQMAVPAQKMGKSRDGGEKHLCKEVPICTSIRLGRISGKDSGQKYADFTGKAHTWPPPPPQPPQTSHGSRRDDSRGRGAAAGGSCGWGLAAPDARLFFPPLVMKRTSQKIGIVEFCCAFQDRTADFLPD
ncbi:hypothetical protein Anapl_17713 [Anas platyrhynchos]|uniref:Uncharacterized protein n=1 Tax=Anas platyrhynchos TaxID=8839 RepID=R0J8M8_ANAPL|nr:hypothetical protein Anapl_17713 [Anas platyrhynchos]